MFNQELFSNMSREHNLTLLQSEMQEIRRIVLKDGLKDFVWWQRHNEKEDEETIEQYIDRFLNSN